MKNDLDVQSQNSYDLEANLKRLESAHQLEIDDMKAKLQHFEDHNNKSSIAGKKEERGTLWSPSKIRKNASGNKEYDVEMILDHRNATRRKLKFLIKWKGYDESQNTWVNRDDLNCPNILQNYLKSKNLV